MDYLSIIILCFCCVIFSHGQNRYGGGRGFGRGMGAHLMSGHGFGNPSSFILFSLLWNFASHSLSIDSFPSYIKN